MKKYILLFCLFLSNNQIFSGGSDINLTNTAYFCVNFFFSSFVNYFSIIIGKKLMAMYLKQKDFDCPTDEERMSDMKKIEKYKKCDLIFRRLFDIYTGIFQPLIIMKNNDSNLIQIKGFDAQIIVGALLGIFSEGTRYALLKKPYFNYDLQ